MRATYGSLILAITVLVTATTAGAVSNPTVTGPITAACSPLCPSPPGPANGIHIPTAMWKSARRS